MDQWSLEGELILNCNCTVFCPCVISLGKHPPTEGYCQAWAGVRIDKGHSGSVDLSGLNVAMLLDIPGKMERGNWTLALWIDDRATDEQFAALETVFRGSARGTTGLFTLLVGNYLGAERAPVEFVTDGDTRTLSVGRIIQGEVRPIAGARGGEEVSVVNTQYWMGPEVVVAEAVKGRVRAFGRVWNFEGRSAEICRIKWEGP
ncbi:MAG: DUF1326 domain-containing protein [Acidobacteria bacterium]|nr:DUF1326 domain-containing protein [Acidobacteriota bacterium]